MTYNDPDERARKLAAPPKEIREDVLFLLFPTDTSLEEWNTLSNQVKNYLATGEEPNVPERYEFACQSDLIRDEMKALRESVASLENILGISNDW